MEDTVTDYHDYLIEGVRSGPRQELGFLVRTPMGTPFAWLRFSAISNYSAVQVWRQDNEREIEATNAGKMLIRIEKCECKPLNSRECQYSIALHYVDDLSFQSRKVQELEYSSW